MIKLFVTATDTDAGKTYCARALTHALTTQHYNVAVFKPISAGCDKAVINNETVFVNEDAALLMQEANCGQLITQINPIAFEEPIAPHIAAKLQHKHLELNNIIDAYNEVTKNNADIVITEGAGGWRLPLGQNKFLSDFAKVTKQKVILVVNMKLGCLNHAILTFESIISDKLDCIGWIANCQEEMPYLQENIQELTEILPTPLLATLTYESDIAKASEKFNIQAITQN